MGKGKGKENRDFPSIASCDPSGREEHAVAADLDGTLLVSRSAFPYFMLLAVEAGGFLRGFLLLFLSPLALFLYRLVSEAAGIQLLIFVSVAGLRVRDVEAAARAVLPRFYAADVRADSWRAFRACGRRRVVVTANPTVMVEPFVKGWLGGDRVLGTELEVEPRTGRFTGFTAGPGVLVGDRKRESLLREFAGEEKTPELGMGDRETDHDFMALCKEGYMVPPDRSAARVPLDQLCSPMVFHDGRFVRRPEPLTAILTFLWTPFGLALSLLRLFLFHLTLPFPLLRHTHLICAINLVVRGAVPPPPPSPKSAGHLFVCNHRTALDPVALSAALGRRVSLIADSGAGRPSGLLSRVPVVQLSRDRAADAALVSALLQRGDLVVFPEGTTCREPFLLRFSTLFAELSDRIVPVAINTKQGVFHGTTTRGYKLLDPCFFFMNPSPTYEVTFLGRLPEEWTCKGGRRAMEVADRVEKLLARALGFQRTSLTWADKSLVLVGAPLQPGGDGEPRVVADS